MKLSPAVTYGLSALVSLTFIGIGIYYLLPGSLHLFKVLVFDDPYGVHLKHALVFFGLALLSPIAARFVVNGQRASAPK